MASNRIGRINEEIQRELADQLRHLKDPRVSQVGMVSASGFLRRELGRALQLRYTPELQFIGDDSIQYGAHILEVLRDPNRVKPENPANADIVLDEEA